MHGLGSREFRDGRCYLGQWEKGKMHGLGQYVWGDKKRYIGYFIDDKKDGYGKYIYPDGRIYKGYWRKGKQHGLAKFKITQEVEAGTKQVTTRYGLWEDGKVVKWFPINSDKDP